MFVRHQIVDLRADESFSALPVTLVASPVTWHVAIWILISLAINSMAQPSGRICGILYRYRLYLSSSPILCTVDAFSAIICLIITSIYFRISPQKACYLVAVSRFEEYVGTQEGNNLSTPPAPLLPPKMYPGPMRNSWPRYLFFVMGTLPAAIKLASFAGNPWTKAWGFMFLASFNIVELIFMLAQRQGEVSFSLVTNPNMGAWYWSVPAVLDLSWEKWLEPQNKNLHTKTASLRFWLQISDRFLFVLALIFHLIVLVWALEIIWRPVAKIYNTLDIIFELDFIVFAILLHTLGIFICLWVGIRFIRCIGYNAQGSFLARFFGLWLVIFMIWIVISPIKYDDSIATTSPWVDESRKWKLFFTPLYYLWMTYYIIYCMMDCVGRRWPAVTKALLIEQVGWGQVDELAEQVSSESLLNKSANGKPGGPINEFAFFCLFFFLTNLGICLTWYAIVYDPTGTINPAWTDVFGR